jgi:hypothetical protein
MFSLACYNWKGDRGLPRRNGFAGRVSLEVELPVVDGKPGRAERRRYALGRGMPKIAGRTISQSFNFLTGSIPGPQSPGGWKNKDRDVSFFRRFKPNTNS